LADPSGSKPKTPTKKQTPDKSENAPNAPKIINKHSDSGNNVKLRWDKTYVGSVSKVNADGIIGKQCSSLEEAQSLVNKLKERKENNVVSKPDKPETKEEGGQKKSTEPVEVQSFSIFNISHFNRTVNNFLSNINPLSYGHSNFSNMDIKDKQEYLAQINTIRKWLDKIETIINEGD
jgi:hypothetical protein